MKGHITGQHSNILTPPERHLLAPPSKKIRLQSPDVLYDSLDDIPTETHDATSTPSTSQQRPENPRLDLSGIFLSYICDLGKNPAVTNNTINQVSTETNELMNEVGQLLHNNISEDVSKLGLSSEIVDSINQILNDKFGQLSDPLSQFVSTKRCTKLLQAKGLYTKPHESILGGPSFEAVRPNGQVEAVNRPKYDKVYTITIKSILQKVMSNESIQEVLLWPNGDPSAEMVHCFDGNHVKNLYRTIGRPFLLIEIFYDDIDPGNALGAKAAINKIGNFYMCIKNLPNHFNSTGANIHLIATGYTGDFKKHGYPSIVEQLWLQLSELEDGLDVTLSRGSLTGTHSLPVVLGAIVGDNLGAHQVLGFKEGFTANRFCRRCFITTHELRSESDSATDYAARQHVHHDQVATTLNAASSKEFGINFQCPLNDLKYFHATKNYAADPMHDVLEGVAPMELSHLLRSMIYVP